MLQHGEILLEPSKQLWKEVFNTNPPKVKNKLKDKDKIINLLKESLIKIWPNSKLINYELNKKDKEIIKLLVKDNFEKVNHF